MLLEPQNGQGLTLGLGMKPFLLIAALALVGCAGPSYQGYRTVPKSATVGLPTWVANVSMSWEFEEDDS